MSYSVTVTTVPAGAAVTAFTLCPDTSWPEASVTELSELTNMPNCESAYLASA